MRCPTLRTISASRFVFDVITLFVERKFWYSVVAMDCTSVSGSSLNCLRPVTAFFVQAITSAEKRKTEVIFRIIGYFFAMKFNYYTGWNNKKLFLLFYVNIFFDG